MQTLVLQAIPNQAFTTTLGGSVYEITLQEAKGIMAATIKRDGVVVIAGMRCVANSPLLPCRYQESGNFMFLTAGNEDIPYYTEFGVTQSLAYFTADELTELRAARLVFSPLGDLPLRYKPQGYRIAP